MTCAAARERLPAANDGVDIRWIELQPVAAPSAALRRNHGGAAAKEAGASQSDTAVSETFRDMKLQRVFATIDLDHQASIRLVERLGFTREGIRRQDASIRGEWRDSLVHALLESEWSGISRTHQEKVKRAEQISMTALVGGRSVCGCAREKGHLGVACSRRRNRPLPAPLRGPWSQTG